MNLQKLFESVLKESKDEWMIETTYGTPADEFQELIKVAARKALKNIKAGKDIQEQIFKAQRYCEDYCETDDDDNYIHDYICERAKRLGLIEDYEPQYRLDPSDDEYYGDTRLESLDL